MKIVKKIKVGIINIKGVNIGWADVPVFELENGSHQIPTFITIRGTLLSYNDHVFGYTIEPTTVIEEGSFGFHDFR